MSTTAAIPLWRRRRTRLAAVGGLLGGAPLLLLLLLVFAATMSVRPNCGQPSDAIATPSKAAVADIPGNYLQLYMAAGQRYGLDWSILAGIGSIETNHGRLKAPGVTSGANAFGCCGGPMQFYFVPYSGRLRNGEKNSSTWGAMSVDGNGDGWKIVWDPQDAIPSAARYLKASGAPGNWQKAIFAYNRAQWYVDDVLSRARRYRGAARAQNLTAVAAPTPDTAATVAGQQGDVDAQRAAAVAASTAGSPVGFAIVDATGRVVASHGPSRTNRSASISKAMVLVALTRQAAARPLTSRETSLATAMIEHSDNAAANRLVAQVGAARINAVARQAGMSSWRLVQRKQTAAGYVLGYSRVSAADQARLFAQIDALVPASHRKLAMQLLERIDSTGQWGIYDARAASGTTIRSKSGWRGETGRGWTVNQAAQITVGGQVYGFAVVLGDQASWDAGKRAITAIANAAFPEPTSAPVAGATGCAAAAGAAGGAADVTAAVEPWMNKTWGEILPLGFKAHGWGAGTPWCMLFVQNVLERLGISRPTPKSAHSSDPYTWTTTEHWGEVLHGPKKPAGSDLQLQPGDLVMYGAPYMASAHVNIVESVDQRGVVLVGGNQSCGKGRCVTRRGPVRLVRSGGALRWSSGDTRTIWAIVRPPAPSKAALA